MSELKVGARVHIVGEGCEEEGVITRIETKSSIERSVKFRIALIVGRLLMAIALIAAAWVLINEGFVFWGIFAAIWANNLGGQK